jgi:hypothetical protein
MRDAITRKRMKTKSLTSKVPQKGWGYPLRKKAQAEARALSLETSP